MDEEIKNTDDDFVSFGVNVRFRGMKTQENVEGKTFQVHVKNGKFTFYEVKMPRSNGRCPLIIHGEQCTLEIGHEGKHMWGRGD